jgi:hypothetical protein
LFGYGRLGAGTDMRVTRKKIRVSAEAVEEPVSMIRCISRARPAALLANSLMEKWISGDQEQLRQELETVSLTPEASEFGDEAERMDLVKQIARRMKDAPDLFQPRSASPRAGIWLDLLDHLSVRG